MKINVNKLVDAVAQTGLRKYVVKRFNLEPPKKDKKEDIQFFEARVGEFLYSLDNNNNLDVWGYMDEEEKDRAKKLAEKWPQYMNMLTHDNLLFWLMRDAPVAYGIIRSHPNGENWLKNTLETFIKKVYGFELELEAGGKEEEEVTENSNKEGFYPDGKKKTITKEELEKELQEGAQQQ